MRFRCQILLSPVLNICSNSIRSLLGRECLLCGAETRERLCPACYAGLPYLPEQRCPVCAIPTPEGQVCGACLAALPRFDRVQAAFAYAFPADKLIQGLKYQARLPLAPLLAELLYSQLGQEAKPDLLIPMPLHPARLKERGFNQALELARCLSRRTGIKLAAEACQRVRDTPPQAALPWEARGKNIQGAFTCAGDFSGLRVAVVDDVLTTGATLDELASVLRSRGAARVSGWVVARTLR